MRTRSRSKKKPTDDDARRRPLDARERASHGGDPRRLPAHGTWFDADELRVTALAYASLPPPMRLSAEDYEALKPRRPRFDTHWVFLPFEGRWELQSQDPADEELAIEHVVDFLIGCGVRTPCAADVAAATCGLVIDMHIPSGAIQTILSPCTAIRGCHHQRGSLVPRFHETEG